MGSEYGGNCPPPVPVPPPPTIRKGPHGPPGAPVLVPPPSSTWSNRAQPKPRPSGVLNPMYASAGQSHSSNGRQVLEDHLQRQNISGRPPLSVGSAPMARLPEIAPPPPPPRASSSMPYALPDKVYSCDSKLVVYKDSCKAGILELQGSNGEKAYCFFLSRMVVVQSITRLSDQLLVGRMYKVNARLINEENVIPFLASTVIPKGLDEKLLADFRDPTPDDVEDYGHLASKVFAALQASQASQAPPKLNLPPPSMAYPTAVAAYPDPSYLPPAPPPVAAPLISPFSIGNTTMSSSNVPKPVASPFLQQADMEEQAALAREFEAQEQRKVLEAQQAAQRQLLKEKMRRPVEDDDEPDIRALDRVIENLEAEIEKNTGTKVPAPLPMPTAGRSGDSGPVMVDKYGYVIRSVALPPPTNNIMPGPQISPLVNPMMTNPLANTNPMDYYKSMFTDAPAIPPPQRSSLSLNRDPLPLRSVDLARKTRTKSRSRSPRRRSRSPRRRSKSREKSRRRSRTRSRSRDRRRDRERRRNRSRSRERRRRSRSSRRKSKSRNRSKSRGKEKEKSRDRERERKRRAEAYSGPPVPAFMMHPADRLFSGEAGRQRSARRRMEDKRDGREEVDQHKAALDESLKLIKAMAMGSGDEAEKETYFVTMEAEILSDGQFKQFTQIGAGSEDKVTGVFNKSFFRSILPTYMKDYDMNLILKNQNNLHSSLKLKFNESEAKYTFNHVKKGDEVPETEEKALIAFISYIKKVKMDKNVVIFTHSKEEILPLLMTKLVLFDLVDSFSAAVRGFCDLSSCISNLKLGGVYKESKFTDLPDVYRQIMGKQWPREPRHTDGVAVLSGGILKKLISDYTDYIQDELKAKFSLTKFLNNCGLRSVPELELDLAEAVKKGKAMSIMKERDKAEVTELELLPSDRPAETTIVILKRFLCFEVDDMDDVEEEGINEDDYFESEGLAVTVEERVVIKPGFINPVKMKIVINSEEIIDTSDRDSMAAFLQRGFRGWTLVSKNEIFGGPADAVVVKEEGEEGVKQKRVLQAKRCGITRQILQVSRELRPVEGMEGKSKEELLVTVKVLNPTDVDLVVDVGDEVALAKLEKGANPEKPDMKTYSQIKAEAEDEAKKKEEEELEKEEAARAEERRRRKKRKDRRRREEERKSGKDTSSGRGDEGGRTSLDMDELDFEPVASDESFDEENISSEEDELLTATRSPTTSLSEEEEEDEIVVEKEVMVDQQGSGKEREKSGVISESRSQTRSKSRERRGKSPPRRVGSRDRSRSIERNGRRDGSRKRSPDQRESRERSSRENSRGNKESASRSQETEKDTRKELERTTMVGTHKCNSVLAAEHPDTFIVQVKDNLKTVKMGGEALVTAELALGGRQINVGDLHWKSGSVTLDFTEQMFPQLFPCPNNPERQDSAFAIMQKQIKVKEEKKIIEVVGDSAVLHLRVRNITAKDVFLCRGVTLALFTLSPNQPSTLVTSGSKEVNQGEPLPPGEEALPKPLPAVAPHISSLPQLTLRQEPLEPPAVPTTEELLGWSVKRLKACLAQAQLHQYGLKADLVSRLHNFFSQSPSRVGEMLEVATQQGQVVNNIPQVADKVEPTNYEQLLSQSPQPAAGPKLQCTPDGQYFSNGQPVDVLGGVGRDTGPSLQVGPDGLYYKDGQVVPVLGKSSNNPLNSSIDSSSSMGTVLGVSEISDKEKISNEAKERVMKKIGEIRMYDKKIENRDIEFFPSGMSIKLMEEVTVEAKERKIITIGLAELDLFASELAGRKILVKERMNSKRSLTVHRQVAECQVVDRKSKVEVLVENTKDRAVVIKPSEKYKLIRVHVEKQINDLDYQFAIPEDDDFIEDSDEYFEKEVVDALTTTDIVLKPKTYHTELCVAKLDLDYGSDPLVQVEKTKTSTMKIGMRRMILVPKVVTFIKMENGEGRLSVKLYNASKSIMRISAKTPIAGLRIQKPGVVGSSGMKVEVDKRRRGVGEVQVTDRYLQLKEDELVVLTWHEGEQRWPTFARLNIRKGTTRVAIGESAGSKTSDFRVHLLEKPAI